jgi:AmmeMemoRadiSam system protein B/uncharacterized protein (TIGR00296 family)
MLTSFAKKYFKSNIDSQKVKGLIVPHAGLQYSGLAAATGYLALSKDTRHIIMLSTLHVAFEKAVLFNHRKYKLDIKLDTAGTDYLGQFTDFFEVDKDNSYYSQEYSLAVQLPLLREILPNTVILPILVSSAVPMSYLRAISKILLDKFPSSIIVANCDLTHYGRRFGSTQYPKNQVLYNIKLKDHTFVYDMANKRNKAHELDGSGCINLLFMMIPDLNYKLLSYYNSYNIGNFHKADNDQDKIYTLFNYADPPEPIESIVSYVTMAYTSEPVTNILSQFEQWQLLFLARITLYRELQGTRSKNDDHKIVRTDSMDVHKGVFVTFKNKGKLRGCIGNFMSDKLLYENVIEMTRATVYDSRFVDNPVTWGEYNNIRISISILEAPYKISMQDLYKNKFVAGRHGIILTWWQGSKKITSATYLPEVVVEEKWNKLSYKNMIDTLIDSLHHKAGLNKVNNYNLTVELYDTQPFGELSG